MKKLYGRALGVALIVGGAYAAWAAGPPEMPVLPGEAQRDAGAALVNPEQKVTGTIDEIDHQQGTVSLGSADGPLQLHFPTNAIRDLKKGEKITAQYALLIGDTAKGTRAYDVPKALGEHRMAGTITSVDPENGSLQVKTEETTLKLHFPSTVLQGLKQGERVTVEMAFEKS